MAFIVTGLYVLVLFSAGVFFVRRGKKEKQEKEEHCSISSTSAWDGTNRRSEVSRRSTPDRRQRESVSTP
jgi:hypothetical protein